MGSTTGVMQDWRDAGLEGDRTRGMQDWKDAGMEGWRKRGIHERSNVERRSARKVRCRTGRDSGLK